MAVDHRTSRTTIMINNIKPAEPPPIRMRLPNIGDIINDIKFERLRSRQIDSACFWLVIP